MRMDLRLGISSAVQRAYLVAGVAVVAAYGVRYLAQPVVGDNHPYSLFFPVVLVCAYAFGRGPAAFAAILAAGWPIGRSSSPGTAPPSTWRRSRPWRCS